MNTDNRLYSINRYGVLALDATAIALLFIAARHWIAMFLAGFAGLWGGDYSQIYQDVPYEFLLLIELPALLIVLVAGRRVPGASNFWRRCWALGRFSLQLVFVLHIAVYAFSIWLTGMPEGRWGLILLLTAVLDLACLLSLQSRYYKTLFSEFPRSKAV